MHYYEGEDDIELPEFTYGKRPYRSINTPVWS